jgi:hypothetical protein
VKSETEIEADLQSLEPLLQKDDLFITHAPAYGAVDAIYEREHVGCRALAALLARKPVLAHIHGHVHNGFGREGNHFNVAYELFGPYESTAWVRESAPEPGRMPGAALLAANVSCV